MVWSESATKTLKPVWVQLYEGDRTKEIDYPFGFFLATLAAIKQVNAAINVAKIDMYNAFTSTPP